MRPAPIRRRGGGGRAVSRPTWGRSSSPTS